MNLALDVNKVMTILLIRFGLVVTGIAVLVLLLFTALLVLKRKGRLHDARRYGAYVAPAARAYLSNRRDYRGLSRRGGLLSTVLRVVVNAMDDRNSRR